MDFEDDEEEEAREKGRGKKFPIQMYISEGNHYFKLGKYDLAIEIFNRGLEREPTNEKCLIGRSKCYMNLAKYLEAREDAETALKSHPNSSDAKMLIGDADYFLGDFEKSFLTFYRGHSSRKNHDGLRCGYQMCEKAIENSLNPDVPIVIDEEDLQNIYKLQDDVGHLSKSGRYSEDIDFVTSILQDDPKELFKRTVESVHQDCEFIKEYLTDRHTFWRTQNPKTSKKDTTDSHGGVPDSPGRDDEISSSESKLNASKKSSIEFILKKCIEIVEQAAEGYIREPDFNMADEKVLSNESNLDALKNNNTDSIAKDIEDYIHKPDSYVADEEVSTKEYNLNASENVGADFDKEDAEDDTRKTDSYVAGEEFLSSESNSDVSKNSSTNSIVENSEDNNDDPDSYATEEKDSSNEANSSVSKKRIVDSSTKSAVENIHKSDTSSADDEDEVSQNESTKVK